MYFCLMSKSSPPFQGQTTYADVTARVDSIAMGDTPAEMREGFRELLLGSDPVPDARTLIEIGGVEGRLSGAKNLQDYSGRVVVWFHGGGYVFGSPETHIRATEHFAEAMDCPVFAPRYRLAPEATWPAQLDDAQSVVTALQQQGCAVVLAGDSAGGHLALNTALACARQQHPVQALALFSPNTDRSGLNSTRAINSERDPIVDDQYDAKLADMCFPSAQWPANHPEVSPVLADLSLLPPTHIEVGGRELLRDDAIILFAFAQLAGATISLHETPAAFHMWQVWTPWLREGTASLDRAAKQILTKV